MSAIINLNGQLVAPENARVPAMDHGFLFGDSIYETLRTYRKIPFLLDQHLDRCDNSALGLGLEIPWSREKMVLELGRALEAADNEESLVRIVVTRGSGPLDMNPQTAGPPNVLLYVTPHPEYPATHYSEGVRVLLVETGGSSWGGVDPTIKSGSRLSNVLALGKAKQDGAFEAVMQTATGQLTEGTSSNFFLVQEGRLHTARVEAGLLPGITRQVVLEVAQEEGITVEESTLTPEDLRNAEEAFLTSTTKKVMPVSQVGDRTFGTPGPVTRRLMKAFDAWVEQSLRGEG